MKRIEKIDPETLTGEPRKIFERWSPGGKPLNIVLIYFRNIDLNSNWEAMASHLFFKNSLSDRQREIVVLRTSWQCASDYEFIQHVRIAREGKLLLEDEIRDLLERDPKIDWSPEEKALITASDELVASHGISDETWARLAQHFDARQLLDCIATAGGYTLNSMATSSFDVDIEDNMQREEGLAPSWNGPAFTFIATDASVASVAAPRLPQGDIEDLDAKVKERIADYIKSGDRIAFLSALACYPRLIKDWMPMITYMDHGNTLNDRDRSIVALRTAVNCQSAAEFSDRAIVARRAGLGDPLIDALAKPDAAGLDRRTQLLVAAVDELVETKIIGDALWGEMKTEFQDEELMDIVFAAATELMICWILNALGVQHEEAPLAARAAG